MTKTIRINAVPDSTVRILKRRAAKMGISLSAYLRIELKKITAKPSMEELQERLRRREPFNAPIDSAAIIREMRGPLD